MDAKLKSEKNCATLKMKFQSRLFLINLLFITIIAFLACDICDDSEFPFQKGIAFTGYWKDSYEGDGARLALRELCRTKATWTSILATGYQDTIDSTTINFTGDETPTDSSLREIIRYAHQLRLKVMLKPHVDLLHDAQHWRGQIGINFTDADWTAWFASYNEFILHYALIAEELDVEQFCIGCELDSTVSHETEWRQIIGDIRSVCKGTLVYADDQIENNPDAIKWWDALDLIGMDAYPTLTQNLHPTVEDLLIGWRAYLAKLQVLSERWNKSLILTEIGYRSILGGAQNPWDWQRQGPVDLTVQANCYEAALKIVMGKSWLVGIYWWQWLPDPNRGGPYDTGYTPHGKPAEEILSFWYSTRL